MNIKRIRLGARRVIHVGSGINGLPVAAAVEGSAPVLNLWVFLARGALFIPAVCQQILFIQQRSPDNRTNSPVAYDTCITL